MFMRFDKRQFKHDKTQINQINNLNNLFFAIIHHHNPQQW